MVWLCGFGGRRGFLVCVAWTGCGLELVWWHLGAFWFGILVVGCSLWCVVPLGFVFGGGFRVRWFGLVWRSFT